MGFLEVARKGKALQVLPPNATSHVESPHRETDWFDKGCC